MSQVQWRLPTLREIIITALIVLPIAFLLTVPLRIVRSVKYAGSNEVKVQLLGASTEIREGVSGILKNPDIVPAVIKEIEIAASHSDPEIRILILETLQKTIPDHDTYASSSVIYLDSIINKMYTDPDINVRNAAESLAETWSQ